MRVLTNLLFKVTVSSMVLTAPAMIDGHPYAGGTLMDRKMEMPWASSFVIKNYIDHVKIWPVRAYADPKSMLEALPYVPRVEKAVAVAEGLATIGVRVKAPVEGGEAVSGKAVRVESSVEGGTAFAPAVAAMAARAAAIRKVIKESDFVYRAIGLGRQGLGETAFEYAWRGYCNLVKKGSIHKRVLSIVDFSQSSSEKRMYVIDIRHRRLLYRTYVAHGQNSGAEYAETFSNEPESFKSSLGFYVTKTTYIGKNGLSLRLNGVDSGYNDKAMQRNIVLHGCSYVGDDYLESFGMTGTSLGCPALPAAVSARIIHAVRGGSCLFIYHPTQDYLDHSEVINE